MIVRIVERLDGGVSIIHPAPKSWRKKDKIKVISEFDEKNKVFKDKTIVVAKAETEEEWLKRVFDKTMKNPLYQGCSYKDVEETEIPTDREFRDAWEFDNSTKKIKVNAAKKKEIEDKRKIKDKIKEIQERQAKKELGIND